MRIGSHTRKHYIKGWVERPGYVVLDELVPLLLEVALPPVVLELKVSPSRLAGALAEIRSVPA